MFLNFFEPVKIVMCTVSVAIILGVPSSVQAAACPFQIAAPFVDHEEILPPQFSLMASSILETTNGNNLFRDRGEVKRRSGLYTVPVEDADLQGVNQFSVKYKFKYSANVLTKVSYDLPKLLTGAVNDIELTFQGVAEDGQQIWKGPKSQGYCTENESSFECRLVYENLSFERDIALSLIEAKTADPSEQQKMISVLDLFITEPCGVIQVQNY